MRFESLNPNIFYIIVTENFKTKKGNNFLKVTV